MDQEFLDLVKVEIKDENHKDHQVYKNKCFCGSKKHKYQSLCNDCYHRLPFVMSQELWRSFRDGFATYYMEATIWLKDNPKEEKNAQISLDI